MPTYEYECTHCGHRFELLQKITASAIDKCPKCNGKVKRLIGSGSGIIFKGSGFYATDYRKKPKTETPKSTKDNICPQTKQDCSSCHKKQPHD
jgi:putative FmdB family regulatory protein